MKTFKEYITEGSKAKHLTAKELTKYSWSGGFNQDDGEVITDGGNIMSNLTSGTLEKYLTKEWDMVNLKLTKLDKNHDGHVEDYVII